jgi:hypothetical protein
MASHGTSSLYNEDRLLEFAFSFIKSVQLLGDEHPTKEIVLSGSSKQNLVFRYFEAWGEPVILAAVLTGKKGYKRALGKLIRLIQSLSW